MSPVCSGCFAPSAERPLEAENGSEVCNEVTPDTAVGLCSGGLRHLHLSGATRG